MINQETEIDILQMNKAQILDFEDFSREMVGDILIESVNFSRATFKEAGLFKDRLVYDILKNNLKIVIDLSHCEYIDSTFLGSLVVVLKKMAERGGEIKYVIPQPSALYLFKITGLYGVLNLYRNRAEAVESFLQSN
ncbi:MAG TPA: STAS domain-containing protein [Ignavibacteriaceae bacterium]|nr:STAS domain-containing protein [Ignavibacteriaceae bacterium]